jgi:hypothetical protein
MKSLFLVLGTLLAACTAIIGCGGGGSMSSTSSADFSLQAGPSTITVVPGGAAQTLSVAASSDNGFKGNITVTLGSLPSGVTASPSSLTLTSGSLGQFSITASPSAAPGTASVTVTGTSGTLTHAASASLTIGSPVTTISLSSTYFDFGDNLVNNTLTQTVVVATNTGSDPVTLNPTLSGDPSYSINSSGTCSQQLAAGANCDVVLNYTPTTASAPATQDATLNLGFGDVPAGTPETVAITGTSGTLSAGVVTATDNPQVALYTLTLPFPGSMVVNFGTGTSYGLTTWSQSTATAGGQVSIFVAGMLGSTQYHMQAAVTFANGITVNDADHTFTTGAVPANMNLSMQATTTAGMTPQPGLEMLNAISGPQTGLIVTDLSGNILWTYRDPGNPNSNVIQGVKMLPDGDILMAIGAESNAPLSGPLPAGTVNEIREVNLAGDTVREISIDDLNAELATAGCAECNVTLDTFHHDVTPLPNGHWLVLASTTMALSKTSTPPLNTSSTTTVLGDVIVDLDQNMKPVWAWNEFNHLDPNRHPMNFPDWTHTNAVIYSKDDGNLLVSVRHQNWVLKVNYADGTGDGSILWHLGAQGDFTLVNGTDPVDWEYAQHGPSFFSTNTSGVFSLGLMDNGDDRVTSPPATPDIFNPGCGTTGAPACYSTIPVWQIDETAKTATLTFHQILPGNLYNSFGGNTEELANGDVEYDLCGLTTGSYVYEVTQDSSAQTVWSLRETTTNLYRAFRIPSFYPGVQW